MKKNSAFTLIELLAVIVILSIIALISTSLIAQVTENAKKSGYKDSAYSILSSLRYYYAGKIINDEEISTDNVLSILEYNGDIPESGTAKVTPDGSFALALKFGDYCLKKNFTDTTISIDDYNANECTIDNYEMVDIFYESLLINSGNINNDFFTLLDYDALYSIWQGVETEYHNVMPISGDSFSYDSTSDDYPYVYVEFTAPKTGYVNVSVTATCEECTSEDYLDLAVQRESVGGFSVYPSGEFTTSTTTSASGNLAVTEGEKYFIEAGIYYPGNSFTIDDISISDITISDIELAYDVAADTFSVNDYNEFYDISEVDVSDKIIISGDTLPQSVSDISKSYYNVTYKFLTPGGLAIVNVKTYYYIYNLYHMNGSNIEVTNPLTSSLTFKNESCIQMGEPCGVSLRNNKKGLVNMSNSFALDVCGECILYGNPVTLTGGETIAENTLIKIYKGDLLLDTKTVAPIYNNS